MKQLNNFFFLFLFTFSFYLFTCSFSKAQTLEGTTGLFFIPTADMRTDKLVTIGANFVDKSLISFGNYKLDAVTPFLSFNFLPFIEIIGKITRVKRTENDRQGIGDRTISVRIKFINESIFVPSITFGLHDLAGIYGGSEAVRNNSLYLVASKHFSLSDQNDFSISVHTGYGLDKIKAQHHNFIGLFGGVSFKVFSNIELMTEYDGKHSNGGVRIKLFDHISVLGGFLQYKYFSGGASFSFVL